MIMIKQLSCCPAPSALKPGLTDQGPGLPGPQESQLLSTASWVAGPQGPICGKVTHVVMLALPLAGGSERMLTSESQTSYKDRGTLFELEGVSLSAPSTYLQTSTSSLQLGFGLIVARKSVEVSKHCHGQAS